MNLRRPFIVGALLTLVSCSGAAPIPASRAVQHDAGAVPASGQGHGPGFVVPAAPAPVLAPEGGIGAGVPGVQQGAPALPGPARGQTGPAPAQVGQAPAQAAPARSGQACTLMTGRQRAMCIPE